MAFKVVRSAAYLRDLALILDHLAGAYLEFGEPPSDAFDHAVRRIRSINADVRSLGQAPYQGTLRPELAPGLRQVTKNRAIFYFEIDEERAEVRVLAAFFGGQDHQRHMLMRLGAGSEPSIPQ